MPELIAPARRRDWGTRNLIDAVLECDACPADKKAHLLAYEVPSAIVDRVLPRTRVPAPCA